MKGTARFRASPKHGWRFILFSGLPVAYLILAFTQEPDSRGFYTLAALAFAFTAAGIAIMVLTATNWAWVTLDQTGLTYQKQKGTYLISWLEVRQISIIYLESLNEDGLSMHRYIGKRGRIIHFLKYKPSIYYKPVFGKDFIDIIFSEDAITEIRKHWGGMITGYTSSHDAL